MVYNVGPGNVYALSGRHCGPHSSSIKQSILNWHDRPLGGRVVPPINALGKRSVVMGELQSRKMGKLEMKTLLF